MGLTETAKRYVPLSLKVAFHKYKYVPNDLAARLTNKLYGRPDVPPGKLIYLVAGHRNAKAFLDGGRSANETIRSVLLKNNVDVARLENVLDFGCGVGRIMRHWSTTQGPAWHGTDYNSDLIEWCKSHLKFCEFRVNALSGQLPYDAETFDFIYAFSVFTHLGEPLAEFWINELSRVLKPGGFVYLTTHGEYYLSVLTAEERAQFQSGKLVIREQARSGSNLCAVFHPPSYVRENLARNFEVADFIPSGAKGDSMHDVHLLKKPV